VPDYLKLAQEAYDASTTYFDANLRSDIDYSLRAFRGEHAKGSKYLSVDYKGRSKLFLPQTRTVIRKNEAAAAVALFSNMDVVDIQPGNPDDVMSVASAAAMKEILEYRLSRTIPAFPLVIGAVQDAQVTGTVCSYQYWDYLKRGDKVVRDKPCIELRPIENIGLDHGASWLDPVNTSPYFYDIVPMYVCDVRGMMDSKNDKTGEPKWKKFKDEIIAKARPDVMETARQMRLGDKQNPEEETSGIKEFDIVWVLRWFMKDSQGSDRVFYTLGREELLTEDKPIDEVYFHGKRPYVIGCSIIETHRALKSGVAILTRGLQQASNNLENQRFDNVSFVLNKRWLVARGRQVDVQSLVRNVPGGVTLLTDPKNDVQESNWADVTSSSYVEHDRLKSSFDDLVGNFSPSTRVANKAVNDTVRGSQIANQSAGIMTDYLLRTVIETWWEPVLRQLVMLEQHYETDELVLGVCAQKARLFPRFGVSKINDFLLEKEVNLTVNVGMGASNPNDKFQKFMTATGAAIQMVTTAPPGFNVMEGIKEIYSNAGYRDGARFFSEQQDPRLMKMMQQMQQMQQMLKGKHMELQQQTQVEQMKLTSNERVKGAELLVDRRRIEGDLAIRQSEVAIEKARVYLEQLQSQLEAQGVENENKQQMIELIKTVEEAKAKLEHQRLKNQEATFRLAAAVHEKEAA
jgi:hypothetical protein